MDTLAQELDQGLTARLAGFGLALTYEDLPKDILTSARYCVLDHLGAAMTGASAELSLILQEEATLQGGNREAQVVGTDLRFPAPMAALLNGASAHALELDDANLTFGGHTTSAMLPAVLALGERLGSTGRECLTAYVAGYETASRISIGCEPDSERRGFHYTGTVGVFGATLACAHLLKLDLGRTIHAFGLAAAQSAGLRIEGATMSKPFHAGKAAQNGLLAAVLAARGFTAKEKVLERPRGYYAAYGSGPRVGEPVPDDTFFMRANLFKFRASCFFTHPSMECALRLRRAHELQPDQIADATVRLNPHIYKVCEILEPADVLQSKRSVPHMVAMELLGLDSTVPGNYDASLKDQAVAALRKRISIETDDRIPESGAGLNIRLKRGGSVDTECDLYEQPRIDALEAPLRDKFMALAGVRIGEANAAMLMRQALSFDSAKGIGGLLRLTGSNDGMEES